MTPQTDLASSIAAALDTPEPPKPSLLELTWTEAAIWQVLHAHINTYVPRTEILRLVWGLEDTRVTVENSAMLSAHLVNLRRKAGEAGCVIFSKPGRGVRLTIPETPVYATERVRGSPHRLFVGSEPTRAGFDPRASS